MRSIDSIMGEIATEAAEPFDIFRGLVTNGFTFRGVDQLGGATFEHTCGAVTRIGPGAHVSLIALTIGEHKCEPVGRPGATPELP